MADIVLRQDGQLPIPTMVRYRDMGDGTHALVMAGAGGGATQYEEDTPSAGGELGTMPLAVRNDAGGSLVSANGDFAPLQVNAAGQLVIAGGAGGTSMADDAPFAPGATQITPIGAMLDDVAPDLVDEGDAGIPRMSANRNLYVRIRDDAGNERGLNVDAGGRLGANAHDGAGAALTSTLVGADQALDVNIVAGAGAGGTSMVDDTAFTPASTAITPAGAMFDDVAPDSVDEGDAGIVRMSANRNLYTTLRDAAGNERGLNVDAAGAIAVTDGGGALTVDNPALSVVGGGAEATAQRVTIANDSTGVLSVDDNAGSLTVDQATHDNLQCNANIQVGDADASNGNPVPISDAGGTITVDGTVAIQEPLSVDDNGGSLTVDNPALSVVGGGAEATAQRVTIANDSTGLVSVDDGGGTLTVDGTVVASDAAGDTAHDAVDGGNPVKLGARAIETDGTDPGEVAEADRTDLKADMNGRLLVNTGHPNAWKTNNNYAAAQTDTELKAAPGANLSLYITAVILSTEEAQNIQIVSDTAGGPSTVELGPYYFAANGGMVAMTFEPAIRIAANTNIGVTSSGAVNHTITLNGYVAP